MIIYSWQHFQAVVSRYTTARFMQALYNIRAFALICSEVISILISDDLRLTIDLEMDD